MAILTNEVNLNSAPRLIRKPNSGYTTTGAGISKSNRQPASGKRATHQNRPPGVHPVQCTGAGTANLERGAKNNRNLSTKPPTICLPTGDLFFSPPHEASNHLRKNFADRINKLPQSSALK